MIFPVQQSTCIHPPHPIPQEMLQHHTVEALSQIWRLGYLKTKTSPVSSSVQVSLDQYHTEEEIYQMSLHREPRKPAVSITSLETVGPVSDSILGNYVLPSYEGWSQLNAC